MYPHTLVTYKQTSSSSVLYSRCPNYRFVSDFGRSLLGAILLSKKLPLKTRLKILNSYVMFVITRILSSS